MEEDFYKVLEVAREADDATIKKAYRKIARENHPDLNPDNPEAEERFKKASVAFEVLSDSEKRKLYDEFGAAGLREGFDRDQARRYQQWQGRPGFGATPGGGGPQFYWSSGGSDANFENIFGSVFGGRSPFDTSDYADFGGFYTGPLKGQDIEASLTLDFLTAVRGGELDLRVDGRQIKVRIPAGADDGDKLRLKGKGGPAPADAPKGSRAGDLLLNLHVKPHPLLSREGLNLYLDVPVTVAEAVAGAKISVPTPHGDYVVTVPAGVHSGAKLRLKDKGVQRGKKAGDFFAVVQIHAPDLATEDVKEAAQALDAGYSRPVRADLKL